MFSLCGNSMRQWSCCESLFWILPSFFSGFSWENEGVGTFMWNKSNSENDHVENCVGNPDARSKPESWSKPLLDANIKTWSYSKRISPPRGAAVGAPQPPCTCTCTAQLWVHHQTLLIGLHCTSVLFLLPCTQWLTLHVSYPLSLILLSALSIIKDMQTQWVLQTTVFSVELSSSLDATSYPVSVQYQEPLLLRVYFSLLGLSAHQVMGSAPSSPPQGRIAFLYLVRCT